MVYLHKILLILPKDSLTTIEKELSPLQVEIVNVIKNDINNTKLSLSDIHKQIKLSISNAYLRKEINAIVNTIYGAVSNNNPIELINWLSKNAFHNQIPHEIKKIEKICAKNKDVETLAETYFVSVEKFLSAYVEFVDLDYIDYLISEFKKHKPNETDRQLTLLCQRKCAEFNILRVNPIKDPEEFERQKKNYSEFLKEIKPKIKKNSNVLLQIWYWKVADDFDGHFNKKANREKITNTLITIYEENKSEVYPTYVYNLLLRKPFSLYEIGQLDLAYQEFKTCLKQTPFKLTNYWYDIFAQCCIAIEKYEEAHETLIFAYELTPENIERKAEIDFNAMALFGLVHLLKSNYQEAERFINLAVINCDKQRYAILYLMIKYIETGLYLAMQNWEKAQILNDNALNFYRYHKGESYYALFYDAHKIFHFIIKSHKQAVPVKFKENYNAFQHGEIAFLGRLLTHLFNKFEMKLSW